MRGCQRQVAVINYAAVLPGWRARVAFKSAHYAPKSELLVAGVSCRCGGMHEPVLTRHGHTAAS